jgi:hypothetical protein
MEPYWNDVRLRQVKGRAIRIGSHLELPEEDRNVSIYTYISCFSPEAQMLKSGEGRIDETIRLADSVDKKEALALKLPIGEKSPTYVVTTDERLYLIAQRKKIILDSLESTMKSAAVDCELNAGENDGIQCFRIEGQATQYLFDPNLEVDKIVTSIELKEVRGDLQSRVSRALDVSAPSAPVVDRIKVLRIRGIEYLLKPAEGTTTEFLLYGRNDTTFVGRVFGTISSDPTLGKYTSLHLYETQ